ncbi:MAG: LarC family nickel insertion protein [Candidatus Eisenbacteria bacterium]|jgi:hypothetical protein|nr:LarC family nickel insertion protein [Candidatus Eisenbacteria bacterium]
MTVDMPQAGKNPIHLAIDPAMGMAGDMFAAALVGLGVPADRAEALMESAAEPLGGAEVHVRQVQLLEGTIAYRVSSTLRTQREPLRLDEAFGFLQQSLHFARVGGQYHDFASRALHALGHAEHHAHGLDHHHDAGEGLGVMLHEAQDIVMDLAMAAWGLQWLGVAMNSVTCMTPVQVGDGVIRFSHGAFEVPAPATAEILAHHAIPWARGPQRFEQLTPTGAAILAALRPRFISRHSPRVAPRIGVGLGSRVTMPPNALILTISEEPMSAAAGAVTLAGQTPPPGSNGAPP